MGKKLMSVGSVLVKEKIVRACNHGRPVGCRDVDVGVARQRACLCVNDISSYMSQCLRVGSRPHVRLMFTSRRC